MVFVFCTSSYWQLCMYQVSFQSFLYFPRYGPDRHLLWKKWLWWDNSVNIQDMFIVHVCFPSSHCHLCINQVSFQSLLYFSRYDPDYEKLLWGDNIVNIQGRIMVLEHSTSPHCHLSIYQVWFNGNCSFKVICRTRFCNGRTDKAATICFPLQGA